MDQREMGQRRLEAAERVLRGERVRWLVGTRRALVETGNVFGKMLTDARFARLLSEISKTELERELVLMELEEGPRGVEQVAGATGLSPPQVFRHIIMLMKARKVEDKGERDGVELFGPVGGGERK
jgi:DNA-binding transcriptional ArsR family regulator